MLDDLRGLDGKQRSAVLASWLGWTLDAFDFFILVFVFKDVARRSRPMSSPSPGLCS